MGTHRMKRYDTEPTIRTTLGYSDGTPEDLSVGTPTVEFIMRQQNLDGSLGAIKVQGACTIVDAVNGVVEYAWQLGDTDTSGTYLAEWERTRGSAKMTFPTEGFDNVIISDDLDEV